MPHIKTIATNIWKYVVVFAPKIWRYSSHLLGVILTGLVFAIISGLLAQKTSDLPGLVLINILHWVQLGGTLQRVIETVLAILFLIFFLSGIVTFVQELWQTQQSQVSARLRKNMYEFTEEQWEKLLKKYGVEADQLEGSDRHAKIRTLIHKEEVDGWLDQLQDAVKEVITEGIRADEEKITQFLGKTVSGQNCNELTTLGEELLILHPNLSAIRTKTAQAYNQCAQKERRSLAVFESLASSNRRNEIRLLSRAIDLVPQAEFFAWRGAANALEGNFQSAVRDCDRAVQMGPRQAECYYCRAIVYYKQENYTLAIDNITSAINLDSSDSSKAIYYYERCLLHRKLGESQQALDDIKQAIELYSKQEVNYQVVNGLEQYYQVLIELEPQPENYKQLGVFYQVKLPDHKKAIDAFTHAIDLNPQVADYYSLRARSYFNIDNYDEAILDLKKAIDLNPGCIDYYQRRGEIYHEHKKKYEEAIADFTKAIDLDPQDVENYWKRANCKEDRDGNVQSANEDYRRAAEIDAKKTGDLYRYRGREFMGRNLDRAISDFTCAIKLNQQDARSYSRRAESYLLKGEPRKWPADAKKAIELDPELAYDVYFDYHYDWQHRSGSQLDRTIAQDEYLCLLLDSLLQQQGPYHYIRGRAYRDDGEQELAKRDFQQAVQFEFPNAREQLDQLNS